MADRVGDSVGVLIAVAVEAAVSEGGAVAVPVGDGRKVSDGVGVTVHAGVAVSMGVDAGVDVAVEVAVAAANAVSRLPAGTTRSPSPALSPVAGR